ncbi:MAG: acyltransferase family protein [Rubripirellula sp.]
MSQPLTSGIPRRHDLDALRAIAMLLGIALHAALGFAPIPWIVQDVQQSEGFYVFFSVLHGFRMPLFFLISGFFTAMLWRKRGLTALLKHRTKRVFLPCMLGLVTIIPLLNYVSGIAVKSQASQTAAESKDGSKTIWAAAWSGDLASLQQLIDNDKSLDAQQPGTGQTPLSLAVIQNHPEAVALLLKAGANPNETVADGTPPLHYAAILGCSEVAAELFDAGANVEATTADGKGLEEMLNLDWATTQFITGLMGIEVDRKELEAGRSLIAERLGDSVTVQKNPPAKEAIGAVIILLFAMPVFHHLWFLWFLCWLVCAFVVYAAIMDAFNIERTPAWLTSSPLRYLWLIPLTLLPQAVMGLQFPTFGPDTSVGLLPIPQVLFYYAIFFGFGAMYFDCHDDEGRLGRRWWFTLPLSLLVLFPLGFEFTTGSFGFADALAPQAYHRLLSVILQATFAWTMTFACMGMFRRLLHHESRVMRYVSDSSYWLYVAHLPLVVALQFVIRDWQLPALFKFLLLCTVTSGLLLLSYQTMVRYTWIGRLLNGPRQRPEPILEAKLIETPQTQT